MPILTPPHAGQILMCDYSGFIVPEMVKRRPVVVISPKERRHLGLCAVVPLSTSTPRPNEPHCYKIILPKSLAGKAGLDEECWAKCDIVNTVSLKRLDFIRMGKDANGKRIYSFVKVSTEDLLALRRLVRISITGSD